MSEAILRLPEVQARTGLSRSTIYDRLRSDPPAFPRPISLGGEKARAIGFLASEIDAWIQERITESRGQAA